MPEVGDEGYNEYPKPGPHHDPEKFCIQRLGKEWYENMKNPPNIDDYWTTLPTSLLINLNPLIDYF